MLFGKFKTPFFWNLETLYEYRQNNPAVASTITRSDIGVLVYGDKHSRKKAEDPSFPKLRNSVEEAFNPEDIKHCWNDKLGLYPYFTRAALKDKAVRHEVVVDQEGTADNDADPEAAYLKELNDRNKLCCELLDALGYNGSLFLMQLPNFRSADRSKLVTAPRSKARQDAIASLKAGTGRFFQRTGGAALNDDDIFKAYERQSLKERLDQMDNDKKLRLEAATRQSKAFTIILEISETKY